MYRYCIDWLPNGLYLLYDRAAKMIIDRTTDPAAATAWVRRHGYIDMNLRTAKSLSVDYQRLYPHITQPG